MLPQWTQSQLSISDMNNDNMSIHTMTRTQSISDFNNTEPHNRDRLARHNTDTSYRSHSNSGSVVHTPPA